ncbi:hypothetical protein BGW36DRAFT_443399 [Talaromyces proteolyticus]|uniref:Rhodopsin domain-containing protein n=1 Tax=Talaromyces proteolyticus TaxID=1131652 RepID=A0AAD4KXD5_9EURO|nr:uncharacterized protein BGW36DRAFT_443399 [Talaromyces proteolyticus]KAH8703286.1 hypothetical protein BGW36DRAFT_443399 [Talaromyces proteolyticus]
MAAEEEGDRNQDRAPVVIGVCVLLIIISLVATGLRLYARYLVRLKLWWDDWFCLIGLPFALLSMIFDFVQVKYGFGKHVDTLSAETLMEYGKNFYILLLFYNLGLAFFKLSLLAFYIRVFSVLNTIRTASYILSAAIVAWMIATEFLLIFRCHPVEIAWEGTAQQQATQCINMNTVFVAQAAPTIFFDVIILALPLKHIWALKLNRGQKVGVTVVFLLGFLVTIISIVRLKVIFSTGNDLTYSFVDLGLWSAAEPVTGLLCCSLVTYGPFVKRIPRWLGGSGQKTETSLKSATTTTKKNSTYGYNNAGYRRQRSSDEIQLNSFAANIVESRVTDDDITASAHVAVSKNSTYGPPHNGIQVKQEYFVQQEQV